MHSLFNMKFYDSTLYGVLGIVSTFPSWALSYKIMHQVSIFIYGYHEKGKNYLHFILV